LFCLKVVSKGGAKKVESPTDKGRGLPDWMVGAGDRVGVDESPVKAVAKKPAAGTAATVRGKPTKAQPVPVKAPPAKAKGKLYNFIVN